MSFHRIQTVTAPTEPVLELDRVKLHLGVGHDDDDELILLYLDAATAAVEGTHGIGIPLRIATYKLTLDAFTGGCITIPLRPVTAVNSLQYKDTAGATQTLDSAAYVADVATGTISRAIGGSWPSTASLPGSVTVIFAAGFEIIPADLQAAILLLVGHSYRTREAVVGTEGTATPLAVPMGVEAIFSRYRVLSFGGGN
jgi:uncharacterized phiE125 gp8 family phage protein